MDLEWDEEKRQRKLDFADVERFDLSTIRTYRDIRRDYGEARFNSIGFLNGRLCTFCWTPREGKIRIISLRKANDRECEDYRRQASDA